jgi:hypothetical protein
LLEEETGNIPPELLSKKEQMSQLEEAERSARVAGDRAKAQGEECPA